MAIVVLMRGPKMLVSCNIEISLIHSRKAVAASNQSKWNSPVATSFRRRYINLWYSCGGSVRLKPAFSSWIYSSYFSNQTTTQPKIAKSR